MNNNRKSRGKVALVGAGPAEAGLITLKGLEALQDAEVVLYDALIDPLLIASLPESVEKVYVGKRAGKHSLAQPDINELIIHHAEQKKRIVRLKGGDPFIFGRGGEEALFLRSRGIEVEIIPGVTAASAAGAYTGVPLSMRGEAVSVVLFTAHARDRGNGMELPPVAQLGGLKQATLVGYMGVATLPYVVESLINGGLSPQTPAAMIENGGMPSQRIVRSPLINLPTRAAESSVMAPALIVVGKVTEYCNRLSWYKPGVLAGKRVLVTRPVEHAGRMYTLLQQEGATVIPAPSIRSVEHNDKDGWQTFFRERNRGGWLIFTSANGVTHFLRQLIEHHRDIRAIGKFRIAVLGKGTASVLERYHLKADFIPSSSLTSVLAKEFEQQFTQGDFIVRVRGNLGDRKIEDAARQAGGDVLPLHVYDTITADIEEGIRFQIEESGVDLICFTSSSTVESFYEQWGQQEADNLLKAADIASIGPVTSKTIRSKEHEPAVEAEHHNVDGLVTAITGYYRDSLA